MGYSTSMDSNSTAETLPAKPVNNHAEVIRDIIKMLLEKAPEGMRVHDRRSLEHQLEAPDDDRRTWLSLEFELPNRSGSASLHVSFDSRYSSVFYDEEGNAWRQYEMEVGTNWPSFGSAVPEVQMKRLELMTAVTQFAQSIKDAFSYPVYRLVKTAAQIAIEKEEREAGHVVDRVKTFVALNRSKMRVGQERELDLESDDVFKGLPKASWEVEMADNKRYKFEKTGTHAAYLTRLS